MKFISALDTLTLRHERVSIFFLTWLKYPSISSFFGNFSIVYINNYLRMIHYKVYHFVQSIENILFKKKKWKTYVWKQKDSDIIICVNYIYLHYLKIIVNYSELIVILIIIFI